jgi:hypothetical protein
VLFSGGSGKPGDLVEVRIDKTYAFDLVGEIVAVTASAPKRRLALLPSLPAVAQARI